MTRTKASFSFTPCTPLPPVLEAEYALAKSGFKLNPYLLAGEVLKRNLSKQPLSAIDTAMLEQIYG